MTTVAERPDRWAWLVHRQITLAAVAVGVALVGDLTGWVPAALLASAPMALFLVGMFVARRHIGLFCDHCRDRLVRGGAARASRRDWALRLHHWQLLNPWRVLLAVTAVIWVDVALPGVVLLVYLVWPWFVMQVWVCRFHDSVAPWCPYCRDDGGGGGMQVSVPDPTGEARR